MKERQHGVTKKKNEMERRILAFDLGHRFFTCNMIKSNQVTYKDLYIYF